MADNLVTDLLGEWVFHRSGDSTVIGVVRAVYVGSNGVFLVLETEDSEVSLMDFWGPTKIVQRCSVCGRFARKHDLVFIGPENGWQHRGHCKEESL